MVGLIAEGFLLGNASILTNVCLLPLYPGMVAFLTGKMDQETRWWNALLIGLLVLFGILTMMLLIALVFSAISGIYGNALPYLVLISYTLVVVLGVMMLLGYNPFNRLTSVQAPLLGNPYATAYVYGLLLAPMTLPCTGPVLLAALSRGAASTGAAFSELIYFTAFGFGFGWPLLLLPLLAVGAQRQFVGWMTSNYSLLTRVAGVLLVCVGLFGFWADRALFSEIFV